MPADNRPELLGVVRVDQVAQLMDHHIVGDGMRCLDDVPVEDHLSLLVARPPTRPEIPNAHSSRRHTDLLGIAICLVLESFLCSVPIPILQVLLNP